MQVARLFRSPNARNLFCMGFAGLFLELMLIRYLAGNIWNLGYFPNLVLISAFVGMGLGFVLHQHVTPRLSDVLLQASIWLLLGLVLFVYYAHPVLPGFEAGRGIVDGDLYFTATPERTREQGPWLFFVCILVVTTIFSFLSQRTAKLFRTFAPLRAYTLDILGSCAGILCFILISWLRIPAWVWFGVFTGVLLLPISGSLGNRWLSLVPGLALVLLVRHQDGIFLANSSYQGELQSAWSPYQKVEFVEPQATRVIYVNGVVHQGMRTAERMRDYFYQKIHDRRHADQLAPYGDVLVLGAGSGNDVAAALMNGAEHVDAVEIDPVIADLGKQHHPEHPYQSEKVDLIIDDGRAFMTRTRRRYDLIIFALTDSVVKVSSMSQLRLENYLFTAESVQKAYRLLAPGGDMVFYNYYRQSWLREKIEEMIRRATGVEPELLLAYSDFAVLRARKGGPPAAVANRAIDIPTDDWPFLYLLRRGIPALYQGAMLAMVAAVVLLAGLLHLSMRRLPEYAGAGMLATKLAFVLMGSAFLLLETKSIIQFSLLFGTTWLNSSLVFLAVLLSVLVANWTAVLIRTQRAISIIYACLLFSCLSSLAFPLARLLQVDIVPLRFILASVLTFAPIFFANLIFSVTFRNQPLAEHLFGWNLIGATVGGVAEYTSMYFGYSFLALVVAGLYAVVIVLLTVAKSR